jgi:DNA-binding NtrC family response regulator
MSSRTDGALRTPATCRPRDRVSQAVVPFLGDDSKVRAVLDTVRRIAATEATVLISGESGTGKELIARFLHRLSARCDANFVSINCGAVVETLVESELFGHARGAFTGAEVRRVGWFEAADAGTIFLDELGEMSRPLQVALLRVLQTGEYTPVGTSETRYCDVRVVAATNTDLAPLIEAGRFRRDLYYRLNIIRVDLPPLRERRDDIPLLAQHFLETYATRYGRPGLSFAPGALDALMRYPFPGNVRELENLVHRAVALSEGDTIEVVRAPAGTAAATPGPVPALPASYHAAKECAIRVFEESYLVDALRRCGGIVSRAARLTGLSERNFHKKLGLHNLDYRSFRFGAEVNDG